VDLLLLVVFVLVPFLVLLPPPEAEEISCVIEDKRMRKIG
jgi:hypothetical protein